MQLGELEAIVQRLVHSRQAGHIGPPSPNIAFEMC